MILEAFTEKKILIVGLGVSGMSLAKMFLKHKINIIAWDDDKIKRNVARKNGITLRAIDEINFPNIDFLILSPGIQHVGKNAHKSALLAKKNNCKIISDLEIINYINKKLFLIGITGTNGKSTTTTLITHILSNCMIDAIACGNIGKPFSEISFRKKNKTLVIEASSYQLERVEKLKFDISILLNLSNDHLERHVNMPNYIDAKLNIFRNQSKKDFAIISIDDEYCREICRTYEQKYESNLIKISTEYNLDKTISIKSHNDLIYIIDKYDNLEVEVNKNKLGFFGGKHNLQNLLAAYACCKVYGIKKINFINSLYSFKGLEHRAEKFIVFKNIIFYNDSKATNINSSNVILENLSNIYWLVGGKPKQGTLKNLERNLKNVREIFTFGEASIKFHKRLKDKVNTTPFKSLKNAINFAFKKAIIEKKPINFVLSPACSSFDEFENFEERGSFFKQTVKRLIKEQKLNEYKKSG